MTEAMDWAAVNAWLQAQLRPTGKEQVAAQAGRRLVANRPSQAGW